MFNEQMDDTEKWMKSMAQICEVLTNNFLFLQALTIE